MDWQSIVAEPATARERSALFSTLLFSGEHRIIAEIASQLLEQSVFAIIQDSMTDRFKLRARLEYPGKEERTVERQTAAQLKANDNATPTARLREKTNPRPLRCRRP
jgi:hypothetical protein